MKMFLFYRKMLLNLTKYLMSSVFSLYIYKHLHKLKLLNMLYILSVWKNLDIHCINKICYFFCTGRIIKCIYVNQCFNMLQILSILKKTIIEKENLQDIKLYINVSWHPIISSPKYIFWIRNFPPPKWL